MAAILNALPPPPFLGLGARLAEGTWGVVLLS
jgi:hypothetical protein